MITRAYPRYKETGIEWLGRVPDHWKVLPCRHFMEESSIKNETGEVKDYLSLIANIGVIPYEEKGDIGNKKPDDLAKCKLVEEGDLLINSMNYGIGSYGLSAYRGVCSPVYIVMRPMAGTVTAEFAFRLFQNRSFQLYAQSFGNGILAHRAAIGWDTLKTLPMPLPPLAEQTAIADFLDRETGKIDALVGEQKRLIELLKEKRQAVISHAVTKGINPDMPMKDSGVEWLGEVPEHWEVKRLSHLSKPGTSITYGIVQAGPDIEGGVPYIRTSEMAGEELPTDGYLRTSPEIDEAYSRSRVRQGDLVIAIRATIGKPLIVPAALDGANLTQGTAKFSPRDGVLNRYICHYLRSDGAISEFARISKGATFKEITLDMLRRFPVLLPPISEQHSICGHLAESLSSLGELISDCVLATNLLLERRAALISAAVTGKIDVRDYAKRETETA